MDPSALSKAAAALESAIRALESRSDSLEAWLKFWIFLVVAGVVFEVAVVVAEYCHGLKDFRRGTIRSPERPAIRMFVFELFAASLVAIGVAGELGIDFMSRDVETGLRNKNRELVGLFQGASSAAIERASKADERASAANERASKNEKDAAELRKRAEDEALARIRLAEAIAWRTPDRTLITQLAPLLQRFSGQRVAFVSELSDPERNNVLSWIGILLGTAEWRLEAAPSLPRSELTFQATNIVLWLSPTAPNGVLEAARALVPVMERAGLPVVVLQSGWGPQPDAAPPELIRIVLFKKGPRMTVTGNMITFEGLPTRIFFGSGPPH